MRHAEEALISTLLDEPPSQKIYKKIYKRLRRYVVLLHCGKGVIKIRDLAIQYRQIIVTTSFLSLLLISQYGSIADIINYRKELLKQISPETGYVLSDILNLNTLNSNNPSLNEVALSGENMGGIDANAKNIVPDKTSGLKQHVVQAGETLTGIAALYDLHSGSIVLVNPDLANTEVLNIGQILSIPEVDASDDALAKEFSDRQKKLAVEADKKQKTVTASTVKKGKTLANIIKVSGYIVPVSYKYISQYFGNGHTGMDMVANIGVPIKAAQSGCIISISGGWNGGYGNMIHLSHGGGSSTLYGHMSAFASGLDTGSCVNAGEVIGYVGSTGRSTGSHLHFEYRVNGVPQNPQQLWN